MRRICCELVVAGWLLSWNVLAQPLQDPITDLFTPRPPTPSGAEDQPAVLRPPEPRPGGPVALPGASRPQPRPPFAFKPGERVLFLGDAILEAEADYGYFETRLDSHYPGSTFTFRNLSRSPHNRLRDADPASAAADSAWLAALLAEARVVEPSLVVLSYGTAAARRGPEALSAFTNVYHRLLDGLLSLNTNAPPRLVVLSPLSFDPPEGATYAEVTNRVAAMLPFAEAAWAAATNRNAEFVDLFSLSRGEVFAGLRAAESGTPRPRLTEDGVRPTPFGARRLSFAFERGLRWPGNTWRFGLMADGSWRSGGFGARIRNHTRADDYVRVIFTEERLPTPNPLVEVNVEKESQPLCYIQVRGLKPGQYELRVDGRGILTGTHADWHRYEIICRGPSWDQAEELRQTIMKKNRAWETWWARQRDRAADQREAPDPQIAELEARIARGKQPVERTYEIVRTGDAPPGTPDTSAIAAP